MGRTAELRALTDLVEPGRSADQGSAVIVAPAGVGKTRLLREALEHADTVGRPSVFAIATQAAAATPYAALAQLAPETSAADHAGVSSWYAEVADTLRAAPGGPTVIGVDDAHLLDSGSAALLLHLALTGSATVLVTVRQGVRPPDPITAMWKDGLAERMDLQPLSPAQIGELIDAMVPGTIAERAKHRIALVSGGNALYARELVRGALEAGSLQERDGLWQWDGTVVLAPRLIDAVSARLADLDSMHLEALATVSMAEPLALPIAELLLSTGTLVRLERLGMVTVSEAESECRVAHPLYGEVARDSLTGSTRRRLLRELIDVVENSGLRTDSDTVLVASGRLRLGQAIDPGLLTAAAVIANHNFDHALAARLAQSAIDHGGGPAAAVQAAIAAAGCSGFAEAEKLLATAESTIVHAHHELCPHYLATRVRALQQGLGQVSDALAMVDRFEAAHDSDDEHARHSHELARAHRAEIYIEDGRLAETVTLGTQLLAVDGVDPLARLMAAETAGEALAYQGLTQRSRALHPIMAALAEAGPPEVRRGTASAVGQQVMCAILDGHVAAGEQLARALHQQTVTDPDPVVRALCCFLVGASVLRAGRPATARRSLMESLAGFRESDISGHIGWLSALLAQTDALVGDVTSARRHLAQATSHRPGRTVARTVTDHVAAHALTRMAEGDTTGAARIALEGAADAGEMVVQRADLLHLAARLGAAPGPIAAQLHTLASNTQTPLIAREAAHIRALADHDGAELAAVADDFAADGALLLAAEAAADAARAYHHAGLTSSAHRLEARSAVLASRCERASTPALTGTGRAAELSRREREVASLAAGGLTNAEIAQRLSLSTRTVESHLYRVFAKLGVNERSGLGLVMRQG